MKMRNTRTRQFIAIAVSTALLLAVGFVMPADATPITDNLIAHWKLDETSDPTAFDTSGSANNYSASIAGQDINQSGQIGTSYNFVPNERLQAPHNAEIFLSGTPFTVTAWANADNPTNGNQAIFFKGRNGATWGAWGMGIEGTPEGQDVPGGADKWVFYMRDGNNSGIDRSVVSSSVAATGAWTHIAATYDNTGAADALKLYINGSQVDSDSGGLTIHTAGTTELNIGADSGRGGFDGRLDDLGIWTRELGADEIEAIYDAGLLGNDLSTVPEPTTFALSALGLLGLLGWGKRFGI